MYTYPPAPLWGTTAVGARSPSPIHNPHTTNYHLPSSIPYQLPRSTDHSSSHKRRDDMPIVDCRLEIAPPCNPPQAQNLSKKETESEGVSRLRTCNREAVQAAADSKKQQQTTVASERNSASWRAGDSKRATECKRAGGAGVSMTTPVFSASFKKHRQESTKRSRSHQIKLPRAP